MQILTFVNNYFKISTSELPGCRLAICAEHRLGEFLNEMAERCESDAGGGRSTGATFHAGALRIWDHKKAIAQLVDARSARRQRQLVSIAADAQPRLPTITSFESKVRISSKISGKSIRFLMATPAGLEPAACRLEGGCSIQLSYGARSACSSRSTQVIRSSNDS